MIISYPEFQVNDKDPTSLATPTIDGRIINSLEIQGLQKGAIHSCISRSSK